MIKFDDAIVEASNIRYGWTPQAVLTMPTEKIDSMSDEELELYFTALLELADKNIRVNTHKVINDNIICTSEEEW